MSLPGCVAPPETHRPAAADQTTAALMWVWQLRRYSLVGGTQFFLFWAVYLLVTRADLAGSDPRYWIFPLLCVVVAAAMWTPLGTGQWAAVSTDKLKVLPWRETAARVLARGVLEVFVDGEPVVLRTRVDPAHLAMVTDTVWLVPIRGPWFMLRVPGSRELFSAKRGKAVPAVELAPVAVTEQWARVLRGQVIAKFGRAVWTAVVFLTAMALSVGLRPAVLALLAAVVIGVPVLAVIWRHLLPNLRLPAVTTWTEADAELSPWRARHDGTARATVTLTLPDGTTRTATLPAAPLDLLGAITDSSTLWVGGTTGRVAVGFPGYPHITYADLT